MNLKAFLPFKAAALIIGFVFLSITDSSAQFGMGNTLAPLPGNDYPIIFSNDAKGGHHQVATLAQRDAITLLRRQPGMLCTVLDDGTGKVKTYQLICEDTNASKADNSNWKEFASGTTAELNGSTILSGEANPASQGKTGDFYINTLDHTIWGPRTADGWPLTGVSIIGTAGTSAYLYVGYAADDQGSGFSLTPGAGLDYIAFRNAITSIAAPEANDFAGLWRKYVSVKGADGQSAYLYVAYAADASGAGFSSIPATGLNFIAVKGSSTQIATPTASDFDGLWIRYAGASGRTILSGNGDPYGGEDGDFYLDLRTYTLYGPKTAGLWTNPVILKGERGPEGDKGETGNTGADGKTILSGFVMGGLPPGSAGNEGDFYIDLSTYTIYGPKAVGAWPPTGTSLVGPSNGAAGGDLTGNFPNPAIAGGAVTAEKISDGAVTSAKLADNSVTEIKIGADAVTTGKIKNDAVTADKISANAVTTVKIEDKAVTLAKIAPGATAGQVLQTNGDATGVEWVTPQAADGGTAFVGNRPITGLPSINQNPGTDDLAEWIQRVFYPSELPTATLSASPSVFEMGSGSQNVALTWSAGRRATTAELVEISIDGASVGSTPEAGATASGQIKPVVSNNHTFQLVVKTADNKQATASASVAFRWKRYWGFLPESVTNPTDAQIISLNQEFATAAGMTKSVSPSGAQKLVIAFPKAWGGSQVIVGGLDQTGTFNKEERSFINESGGTSTFIIYTAKNGTSASVTFTVQ